MVKIGEIQEEEFWSKFDDKLGKNDTMTYKDACRKYNITMEHLKYLIEQKKLIPIKDNGKLRKLVSRFDMERLRECKLLKYKDQK